MMYFLNSCVSDGDMDGEKENSPEYVYTFQLQSLYKMDMETRQSKCGRKIRPLEFNKGKFGLLSAGSFLTFEYPTRDIAVD